MLIQLLLLLSLGLCTVSHHTNEDDGDSNSNRERRWHQGIIPAPATEEAWDTAKCKGRKFVAQMSYSDYDVGQMLPTGANTAASPWFWSDLNAWGYVMSGVGPQYRKFAANGYWGIADFLAHIGIDNKCHEEGGKWIAAAITHYIAGSSQPAAQQPYRGPDGYIRRVSGARFHIAVTAEGGGIMVQDVVGPSAAAAQLYNNYQDYKLPHMKQLSDMMWAMWEYYTYENHQSNVHFMMHLGITNPQTLAIIRRALDSQGQSPSTTPYKFEMNTDGALAI